jgi:broad specificity phosphatase PhoE
VTRWLEVRRHSLTKKGDSRGRGSHLSPDGIALARAVGDRIGPFAYVICGELPRHLETAVAMGFAVDGTVALPSGYVPGEVNHHDQWDWPEPYVRYKEILDQRRGLAKVATAHREIWLHALSSISDGESALVISSGGAIEPTLVSCLPDADHRGWGAPLSHCDGVRLTFEDGRFVDATIDRARP